MKKYLMTGMAAIAFCAAFTSCSKGEDIYDPDFKQKEVTLSYEQAFINTFGQPAADQDWGFGTSTRAFTRANGVGEVIKPDNGKDGIFEFTNEEKNNEAVWRTPQGVAKYVAPITDAEREWVQAWFSNPDNAGLSEEGREFHNFYVQQVHNKLYKDDVDNKEGYFWELKNGVVEKTEKMYKVKMDQLRIGSARDEASTVHINDFNATDNGFNAWNAIYVKDGSSKQFAYWASYGSQWQWKFRCVELTVPGSCFGVGEADRKGWYVGLSYYAAKDEIAGQKGVVIGEDEIDICDDWILKIVPGEGEVIPSTIRVIGEDLSANTPSDFDFNDIVVDVTLTSTGADCVLKAAGGTLPLIIGIKNPDDTKDAVDYPNNEVHKLFGVTVDTMVNTNAENTPDPKDPSKMLKGASRPDVSFSITGNWSTVKDVPIYVKKNGHWMELTAERGVPASKIGVDDTFVWCLEKVNISGQYPRFTNWVTKNLDNQSKWY